MAAAISTDVLAHLLGVGARGFAKHVRRGQVPGAVRSFASTGYVIGWRSASDYLAARLDGDALKLARERLLGLRGGRIRVVDGSFVAVVPARCSSADWLSDEEILRTVREGAACGAAGCGGDFDRWLLSVGAAWRHRDAIVRLTAASWEAVLVRAGVPQQPPEPEDAADLTDPVTVMHEAAAAYGAGGGRELSVVKFDRWAQRNGSPVRSDEIRRLYGSWNAAKVAVGLEVNDHPTHGDRK